MRKSVKKIFALLLILSIVVPCSKVAAVDNHDLGVGEEDKKIEEQVSKQINNADFGTEVSELPDEVFEYANELEISEKLIDTLNYKEEVKCYKFQENQADIYSFEIGGEDSSNIEVSFKLFNEGLKEVGPTREDKKTKLTSEQKYTLNKDLDIGTYYIVLDLNGEIDSKFNVVFNAADGPEEESGDMSPSVKNEDTVDIQDGNNMKDPITVDKPEIKHKNAILLDDCESVPIVFNNTYTGSLDNKNNKEKYYTFFAPYKGDYVVKMKTHGGQDMRATVFVMDEIGNNMAVCQSGSNVSITDQTLNKGRYYIRVLLYSGTAGDFDLIVSRSEEDKEGDTLQTATEIGYDKTHNGSINYEKDEDYFVFEAPYKGDYTVKLQTYDKNFRATLFILDETGKDMVICQSGWDLTRKAEALEVGKYYIRILRYDGYIGDYKLTLSKSEEDKEGDTQQTATEIGYDKTYNGSINYEKDEDYFVFEAPYKGDYTVKLQTYDKNFRATLFILDETGKDMVICQSGWDLTRKAEALEAGKYYIRILRYDGYIGDYKLTLSKSEEDKEGDTQQTATEIGYDRTYNGSINYEKDEDYFVFEAPYKGDYTVKLQTYDNNVLI